MICNKDHRYLPEYSSLPNAQDDQNGGRHICAGCAFEAGMRDGLDNVPPKNDLSYLPYSQAGTVRHKDAKKAYDAGYILGKQKSS